MMSNKNYCIDCGKEVSTKHTKRCGKCYGLSEGGSKHKTWKGGKPKCIDCGKKLSTYNSKYKKYTRCGKCNGIYHSSMIRGKNNPAWVGGVSRGNYNWKFNNILKEIIKNRDNYTCQLCTMTEKEHIKKYGERIQIHHIDYNKNNCLEDNLITLCLKCNNKANYNRDYWYAYFNYIMENN